MKRLLLFLCALAPAALASAQELPKPQPNALRAYDLPNDDGSAIAVEWLPSAGERDPSAPPPGYDYVVEVAAKGPFVEAARVPARSGWKADIGSKFGLLAKQTSTEHALVVDLRSLFSAQRLADAALGNAEALAWAQANFGAEAIERAKEILAKSHVQAAEDLKTYPDAIDDIGRDVILAASYRVRLLARRAADGVAIGLGEVADVRATENWFDWMKLNNLVFMLVLGVSVLYFIRRARRNPNMFLRRIGGLDALDEALGRATEMGKPVLFVHGLETLQKVPTIAAISILGEVAKKVARYDTKLLCANYDPIVLTVSQETVKEGFLRAGRPDAYNSDDVFVAGAEQFSYVAAVDGIMLRQRPAANLYVGYFYAESLLLAETGAQTGAIQIAATDAYTQLPFFVTTCDYTLMGEELYAASAYLSRDPLLLGSLRGQDVGKALVILYIAAGTVALSLGVVVFKLLVQT